MYEQHRTQLESMARAIEKIASKAKDPEMCASIGQIALEVAKVRFLLEEALESVGKKVEDI